MPATFQAAQLAARRSQRSSLPACATHATVAMISAHESACAGAESCGRASWVFISSREVVLSGELAVEARGVVKRFGTDVVAVGGLDLAIKAAETYGLIGPNGAGKPVTEL
jgi:ABC-type glutathione transport system ATPase component